MPRTNKTEGEIAHHFETACDALYEFGKMMPRDRKAYADVIHSFEDVAIAFLKTDHATDNMAEYLRNAAATKSVRLLRAFECREPRSVDGASQMRGWYEIADTGTIEYLELLVRSGLDMRLIHARLMIRASKKKEAPLRAFLIRNVLTLWNGFANLFNLKNAVIAANADWVAQYYRAAVAAYPTSAQRDLGTISRALDGREYTILKLLGVVHKQTDMIPDRITKSECVLSNHEKMTLKAWEEDLTIFLSSVEKLIWAQNRFTA